MALYFIIMLITLDRLVRMKRLIAHNLYRLHIDQNFTPLSSALAVSIAYPEPLCHGFALKSISVEQFQFVFIECKVPLETFADPFKEVETYRNRFETCLTELYDPFQEHFPEKEVVFDQYFNNFGPLSKKFSR